MVRPPETLVAVPADADPGRPTARIDRLAERENGQRDLFQSSCLHAAKVPDPLERARPR
jgi:hypothetical protein